MEDARVLHCGKLIDYSAKPRTTVLAKEESRDLGSAKNSEKNEGKRNRDMEMRRILSSSEACGVAAARIAGSNRSAVGLDRSWVPVEAGSGARTGRWHVASYRRVTETKRTSGRPLGERTLRKIASRPNTPSRHCWTAGGFDLYK